VRGVQPGQRHSGRGGVGALGAAVVPAAPLRGESCGDRTVTSASGNRSQRPGTLVAFTRRANEPNRHHRMRPPDD
jgi:hypothetical protein